MFGLGFVGKGLNVTVNEKMEPVMQNTPQTGHKFLERRGGGGGGGGTLKKATEDYSNTDTSVKRTAHGHDKYARNTFVHTHTYFHSLFLCFQ